MLTEREIIVRLVMAVILGGFIGLERERLHAGYRTSSAGFRTHILVCIGSAICMVVSEEMHFQFQGDAARIAAQVVSGIGFLGAGAIIKEGPFVRGLTTAASLWVVASLGLACGAGYYLIATLGTMLVLFALVLLGAFERLLRGRGSWNTLRVAIRDHPEQIDAISSYFEEHAGIIKKIEVNKTSDQGIVLLEVCFKNLPGSNIVDIMHKLAVMPGVYKVEQVS